MKYFNTFLLFFVFLTTSVSAVVVRVLLDDKEKPSWEFSSPRGFYFQDPVSGKKVYLGATHNKLSIVCRDGKLIINGHKFLHDQVYIKPIKQGTKLFGNTYDGFFLIIKTKTSYLLINVLGIEEYIFAVLHAEGWPGWCVDTYKVMAFTCRSYVLHQLLEAEKKGLSYHIKNTNSHQIYKGIHSCPVIRQAVTETEGLFLAHKGKPILAMFDSCCGGVVPAHIEGAIDFIKAPYLGRKYPCTFCKSCKQFKWRAEYSFLELRTLLQNGRSKKLPEVRDFKITKKDKAGLVKGVTAKTINEQHSFSGTEASKFLKKIKSRSYTVTRKPNSKKVIINGVGRGHQLGLCQWGANTMAKQGWAPEEIVQFYYPGTTFMKLKTITSSGETDARV